MKKTAPTMRLECKMVTLNSIDTLKISILTTIFSDFAHPYFYAPKHALPKLTFACFTAFFKNNAKKTHLKMRKTP